MSRAPQRALKKYNPAKKPFLSSLVWPNTPPSQLSAFGSRKFARPCKMRGSQFSSTETDRDRPMLTTYGGITPVALVIRICTVCSIEEIVALLTP
jgi:hypothetical protein